MLKIIYVLLIASLTPSTCWAVQPHGGLEGLVSHEAGHLLFIVGILFIFFHSRENAWLESGWRKFRIFLLLLLFWNLLTFIGHCMDLSRDSYYFISPDDHRHSIVIDSASELLYYISKLDHFILAPALLFLVLALRKWVKSMEADI